MTNLAWRIVVFVVGIPGLAVLIVLLPGRDHLAFGVLAVIVSAIGSTETASLFARKETGYRAGSFLIPVLGALLPAAALLSVQGFLPAGAPTAALVLAASVVLAAQAFRREQNDFRHIIPSVAANLTVALYPGLFMAHIILIGALPNATALLLIFLATAFLNDTAAYLGGRIFGRARHALLPISPNKTPIGFLFGFATSIGVVFIAGAIVPEMFPGPALLRAVFGALCGVIVILGDLVESALKRSAAAKDSGSLIPGRGGILDSIDSPIFLAPVFYYLYQVLFS